jgi:hypothetical protein
MAAGLASGSVALLMLGLQPLLLGTLADEHRLTDDQIGMAATIELLALGVTTGTLASLLPPARLKTINILGCLALAAANAGGMLSSGWGFVASRGAAGAAGGVLVWIAIVLITRAARPERYSGIFLVAQTLAQAALAAVLPLTLMPHFGANGGLAALSGLAVLSVTASAWIPSALNRLPKPEEGHGGIKLRGVLGLGTVFSTMAGIVGFWVFAEQVGTVAHIGARITGLAVAAALAAQVAGGAAATVLAGRWATISVLAACGVLNIGIVLTFGGAVATPVYLAGVIAFGFLWLFAMPFQTRLLIDLDPTRRTAMLLSAAQMLGSAAGPMVTSSFAEAARLSGAMRADAALFATGLFLLLAAWRLR